MDATCATASVIDLRSVARPTAHAVIRVSSSHSSPPLISCHHLPGAHLLRPHHSRPAESSDGRLHPCCCQRQLAQQDRAAQTAGLVSQSESGRLAVCWPSGEKGSETLEVSFRAPSRNHQRRVCLFPVSNIVTCPCPTVTPLCASPSNRYGRDFATDLWSLLEWLANLLPTSQAVVVMNCLPVGTKVSAAQCVTVVPYSWDFRYIIAPLQ